MPSSRGSSWLGDQTNISCIAGRFFSTEPQGKPSDLLPSIRLLSFFAWIIEMPQTTFLLLFSHSCLTICDPMDCSTPGFPVLHHLLELAEIHVHQVGDAIQQSHPLSSPSPPAFNLSQNQGCSNELVLCIRWPKYWSFSFNISPSNEFAGLISFRMDCFDLLAVQQAFKSLIQHQSSKALILWCSAFLWSNSHPYMTTGEIITLTRPLLAK